MDSLKRRRQARKRSRPCRSGICNKWCQNQVFVVRRTTKSVQAKAKRNRRIGRVQDQCGSETALTTEARFGMV